MSLPFYWDFFLVGGKRIGGEFGSFVCRQISISHYRNVFDSIILNEILLNKFSLMRICILLMLFFFFLPNSIFWFSKILDQTAALRKDREAHQHQQQLLQQASSDGNSGALVKSTNRNGYQADGGAKGHYYEPAASAHLHHVHHHHVHHHHHHHVHFAHTSGNQTLNKSPTAASSVSEIAAAAEALMESDLILQALNGFLLILTCDGEVFYTSHTVETYLGFHQVNLMKNKSQKKDNPIPTKGHIVYSLLALFNLDNLTTKPTDCPHTNYPKQWLIIGD